MYYNSLIVGPIIVHATVSKPNGEDARILIIFVYCRKRCGTTIRITAY